MRTTHGKRTGKQAKGRKPAWASEIAPGSPNGGREALRTGRHRGDFQSGRPDLRAVSSDLSKKEAANRCAGGRGRRANPLGGGGGGGGGPDERRFDTKRNY